MNALLAKYKKMALPLKASMWFVICSIIQKGVAFVTTPIFTRILTQKEYGVVSIYNSWLSILTIIFTLELAMGHFNKGMIKFEKDRDGYTSSILCLSTILITAFFLIYIVAYKGWNSLFELNTVLMILMFIDILSSEAMALWSIRQRFEYRYKGVVAVTLISNIIGTLLSVWLVLNNQNNRVEYRVLGTVLVHLLSYGVIYILIMRKGKRFFVAEYWKYALLYNLPLIPHYLSLILLNQSDRIMIGRICGSEYSAIYTVAYQVAVLMNIVTNAIHSSFTPWAFEKMKNRDYAKIGEYTFGIEVLFAVVCFLFSLFAPELIYVLGGTEYYEAVWIIPPVTMSIVFNVLYSLISNVEFFYEKTKLVMIGTICAATLNIVLNAIFIPVFGFVAAGYTTLACYMVLAMLHYCFMKKICKEKQINSPYDGGKIWSVALVVVALSIFISFLYMYLLVRYAFIVVLMACLLANRKTIMKMVRTKE